MGDSDGREKTFDMFSVCGQFLDSVWKDNRGRFDTPSPSGGPVGRRFNLFSGLEVLNNDLDSSHVRSTRWQRSRAVETGEDVVKGDWPSSNNVGPLRFGEVRGSRGGSLCGTLGKFEPSLIELEENTGLSHAVGE